MVDKVDGFIGSVFGNLVVTGIAGKTGSGIKLYQVKCSVCAKDEELFGTAIFKSLKGDLVRGALPCGCSKKPNWTAAQYRVLISRRASGKYTAVVLEDAKATTKVSCKCSVEDCGHVWEASINNLVNSGTGCSKCGDKASSEARSMPESVAVERIMMICSKKGWVFNGFKNGWKNAYSKILLECSQGHKWSPDYNNVVNNGNGCSKCAVSGYDPSKPGTFYVYLWTHKETGEQHLKYGISNYPIKRIKQQRRANKSYTAKQLFSLDFQDGSIPENIERQIDEFKKANNIPNQVSREEFPDGFSETLPLSCWDFIRDLIQSETMIKISVTKIQSHK